MSMLNKVIAALLITLAPLANYGTQIPPLPWLPKINAWIEKNKSTQLAAEYEKTEYKTIENSNQEVQKVTLPLLIKTGTPNPAALVNKYIISVKAKPKNRVLTTEEHAALLENMSNF